jgi:mRNA-degrading endonuclease RelE of RelBE toxin-antitoxin system
MPYEIIFEPDAMDHLRALSARDRATVFEKVEGQLSYEPGKETRHRKRLRPNPLAPWEVRIGTLRVFYDINEEASEVRIVAVGRKRGNRLFIAGQEFLL